MKTRLREKIFSAAKQSKQTTLDGLPTLQQKQAQASKPNSKKQIVIFEISTELREDELAVKVGFRLLPSKDAFSKIKAALYFDGNELNVAHYSVPQGALVRDDFEFARVLGMKGIGAGSHIIRVEMFELWSSGEILTSASKEVNVNYVPVRREDRLVKVPFVKQVAGEDLIVVSDSDKGIYNQLNEDMKKEQASRRDEW